MPIGFEEPPISCQSAISDAKTVARPVFVFYPTIFSQLSYPHDLILRVHYVEEENQFVRGAAIVQLPFVQLLIQLLLLLLLNSCWKAVERVALRQTQHLRPLLAVCHVNNTVGLIRIVVIIGTRWHAVRAARGEG